MFEKSILIALITITVLFSINLVFSIDSFIINTFGFLSISLMLTLAFRSLYCINNNETSMFR